MSTLASNFPLPNPKPYKLSRWALLRAWLPAFLWMGVIACESTSLFTSTNTRGWVFDVLRHISFWLAARADTINGVGRKVGHFVGYGTLGGLSLLGWTAFFRYRKESYLAALGKFTRVARVWQFRAAVLAVLVTFVVASLDEFHQSFIPGRTPAVHDVLLDTCGGVVAQVIIYLFWRSRRKPQDAAGAPNSRLASEI